MARKAREQSETGFYHITNRGVNKADVFLDAEDHRRFIECLNLAHAVCSFHLIAYCIMTNHFHIIIRCSHKTPVPSSLFQSVGARFCAYYHRKYKTAGQIFQGRFKSEAIESESHLLSAIRYVWNNPVEAGICNAAGAYPWSSFNLLGAETNSVDNRFLYSLMSAKEWRLFTAQENQDWHLEPFPIRSDDKIAQTIIQKMLGHENLEIISRMPSEEFDSLVMRCGSFNVCLSQIARVVGISPRVIFHKMRAIREERESSP